MSIFGRDYEGCPFGVDWAECPPDNYNWEGSWIERGFTSLADAERWYDEICSRNHVAAIYERGRYTDVKGVKREALFYFKANGFFNPRLRERMERGKRGVLWFNEQESTDVVDYTSVKER